LKEEASGLAGTFQYSTERFTRTRIQRLAVHFRLLLEGIVANPEARVSELPLLTGDERQQLLVEWNDTASPAAPEHYLLQQYFEEQAARTPEHLALVFEDEQLTYAQLNTRANQLAYHLRRLGVRSEIPVGIYMERSIEMVVGLLGILKAGGAYMPLDPSHPQERIAFSLADTQSPVILTQARLRDTLPSHDANVVCVDTDWEAIGAESEENPENVGITSDNLAYLIYTSGSTGRPKGVLVTHRGITNHMLWMRQEFPLVETDRLLQKTPFTFDASVWEFFLPLMCGAQLVVARPGGHQDSAYLVETVAQRQITVLQLVPTMLPLFLEEKKVSGCGSLRRVFCGGEALSFDLQERFHARLEASLHNLYGPTETSVQVAYWTCEKDDERRIVPIGRPIANTQIYLLDAYLQPVPVGVAGELFIGGAGLGRGYLNRPDLTADRFIPNPFGDRPGARLYKTGDVCRHLSDGAIEYLGRSDQQVKIRGFRIEPGEIEFLLTQHDGVQACLVLVRQDSPGEQRLVAYVVATNESATGVDELRNYLRERLPEYMIPAAFVMLEALPLMANGKVDRSALPAPGASRVGEGEYVAPRTPFEITLAGIWADVLHLERVGILDNFFNLGGHSLLATRVVSRVNEAYPQTVSLLTLFEKPTLAQFALVIEQAQNPNSGTAHALIKAQPRGRKTRARLLENLEQLSDQQAQEILTQRKHLSN
jgi:amino acid adenylation domain-containing protein